MLFLSLKKSLLLASITAITHAQSFGNYSTISNITSSACPAPGTAHIIVARASTEPLGYGIIGAVKDQVMKDLPGSNAEYVVYPATLTDYVNSESAGVLGMKALVEAYIAKNCAEPLVLMGYSQGAQVTTDYISGQDDTGFSYNATLSEPAPEDVLQKIAAVTVMGDPSINITNNPFHVGNSSKPGLFTRYANASGVLNSIEGKIQSYCDALDPYCASAGNFDHLYVHLGYVQEYGSDAAKFIVQQVKEWFAQNGDATKSENGTANSPTQSASPAEYTGAAAALRSGIGGAFVVTLVAGSILAVAQKL